MLTLPLGQLIEAAPALSRLAKKELPLKLSLHVARIYRHVLAEQRTFEEKRSELVRRLGRPINGSDTIRVSPENLAVFTKQLEEAIIIDITLDCVPMNFAEIADVDGLQIAPEDLVLLKPLLTNAPD